MTRFLGICCSVLCTATFALAQDAPQRGYEVQSKSSLDEFSDTCAGRKHLPIVTLTRVA